MTEQMNKQACRMKEQVILIVHLLIHPTPHSSFRLVGCRDLTLSFTQSGIIFDDVWKYDEKTIHLMRLVQRKREKCSSKVMKSLF